MSIEMHFNRKKQMFVDFFMQVQQVIEDVSLSAQLQIDREYFIAKSLLANQNQQLILHQCMKMRDREPMVLVCIFDTIYEHVRKSVLHITQPNKECIKTLKKEQKILPSVASTDQKLKMTVNFDYSENSKSKNQFDESQRIKNDKKYEENLFYSPVTSFAHNSIPKQTSSQFESTNKKQDHQDPFVHLLNKVSKSKSKSKNCSSKISESSKLFRKEGEEVAIKCLGKPRAQLKEQIQKAQLNYIFQDHMKNRNKQKSNSLNKDPYINDQLGGELEDGLHRKFTSAKASKSLMKQNIHSLSSSHIRVQSVENNQILCEKLDMKIQQQAMQLLLKVKSKRSPSRRKKTQNINGIDKAYRNSMLDISKEAIPVPRGSAKNRLT